MVPHNLGLVNRSRGLTSPPPTKLPISSPCLLQSSRPTAPQGTTSQPHCPRRKSNTSCLAPVSAINLTLVTGEHAFPLLPSSSHQTLSVTILKPTLLGHGVDRAQQGAQDVQITCSGGLGVQITCTGQEPGHRKDQPSGTG
jgi:hypothetical protein